jgi:hypothetical protein
MTTNAIVINRGSDLAAYAIWPGSPSAPLNLTGWTVSVYEPHFALAGHLTVTVGDAAAGRIDIAMDWQPDMPMGREMVFRLQIVNGSQNLTSPVIMIEVQ